MATNPTQAKQIVTCLSCKHAHLHRYDNNPVLAACLKQPQMANPRFPYTVEVAGAPRHCKLYVQELKEKTVEQRNSIQHEVV